MGGVFGYKLTFKFNQHYIEITFCRESTFLCFFLKERFLFILQLAILNAGAVGKQIKLKSKFELSKYLISLVINIRTVDISEYVDPDSNK